MSVTADVHEVSADPRGTIRSFIEQRYPDVAFQDSENIFGLGFVNSLFAMELVVFIEKAFSCQIPNEELRLPNFRTVDAMTDLVARLSGTKA